MGLQDTEDLVTGQEADLGDTVRVTEGDTDLGRREALAGELDDVLDDVVGRRLEPGRGSAAVGEGGGRNALSGSVHTTHVGSRTYVQHFALIVGDAALTDFGGGERVLRSCRRRGRRAR